MFRCKPGLGQLDYVVGLKSPNIYVSFFLSWSWNVDEVLFMLKQLQMYLEALKSKNANKVNERHKTLSTRTTSHKTKSELTQNHLLKKVLWFGSSDIWWKSNYKSQNGMSVSTLSVYLICLYHQCSYFRQYSKDIEFHSSIIIKD